jgi:hypothetical protein
MFEQFKDVNHTTIDASDQAQYAKCNDDHIFPQTPVSFAQSWLFPGCYQINTAWQD